MTLHTSSWTSDAPHQFSDAQKLHGKGTNKQTNRQTDKQTHGHRESMKESAKGPILWKAVIQDLHAFKNWGLDFAGKLYFPCVEKHQSVFTIEVSKETIRFLFSIQHNNGPFIIETQSFVSSEKKRASRMLIKAGPVLHLTKYLWYDYWAGCF